MSRGKKVQAKGAQKGVKCGNERKKKVLIKKLFSLPQLRWDVEGTFFING